MSEVIGKAAGQIWHYLAKNNTPISIASLAKKTDLSSAMVTMAVGWLAKEGKLVFEEKGKQLLVSLCPSEVCS